MRPEITIRIHRSNSGCLAIELTTLLLQFLDASDLFLLQPIATAFSAPVVFFHRLRACHQAITLLQHHALATSRSCNITLLQHHALATSRSCNITLLQHHALATSRSCNITLLQHHALATSRSCNITLLQRR